MHNLTHLGGCQSAFSTSWKGSIKVVLEGASLREDHTVKTALTYTILFERFLKGVDLRVGIKYKPDQEISIELMKLLMKNMEVS